MAKIRIDRDGGITVDGEPFELVQLRVFLEEHRSRGGTIWFYRENGSAEAHPTVLVVMRFITNMGLSLSVSTRADFADMTMQDNGVRPGAAAQGG